ncbi:transposable element Tcb1 transposase [Trichonephila inaurata madagascariensis]|uniref:Transposable element Tcb1 transposase n=1 Tax=Trichonephila inaurata madagascariensis TaxID=2747483 RepID=A0A8X7C7F0_9ARAC|nr:transposable element Tcb1 transposase [Trichonephila inaurata madagascariensis]
MSQGKETSLELQNLIVKLKDENKSYSEIAKIVKKPRSTVQTIYRNYVMRGNMLNKSRCGHPHKLSDRDARAIVRKVKKNPKISAPKLADQIATASGKKVHPETVLRILRSGSYNCRVSRKKPFISSVNQRKRLDFASAHVDKDFDFWKTVVFTDESKFNVFGRDGRRKEVDRRVRQQAITSKETLRKAIEHAWAQISPEKTNILVMSMPNRMQAVIASKGDPTKY